MDAHPETRYHVHGQAEPDDTGKRSAVKAARYVWREAFGKVPSADGNSLDAYPTRKMERLCERLVGYDRLVGEHTYRQLTELYRALRLYVNCFQPSMKLQSKQREGKKVRYVYDPAKTPLQRLLLSGVLPAQKQQVLLEVAHALDPIRLFEQLEQLQQAVFRCATRCSPFVPSLPSAPLRVFSVERSSAANVPDERSVPNPVVFHTVAKTRYYPDITHA